MSHTSHLRTGCRRAAHPRTFAGQGTAQPSVRWWALAAGCVALFFLSGVQWTEAAVQDAIVRCSDDGRTVNAAFSSAGLDGAPYRIWIRETSAPSGQYVYQDNSATPNDLAANSYSITPGQEYEISFNDGDYGDGAWITFTCYDSTALPAHTFDGASDIFFSDSCSTVTLGWDYISEAAGHQIRLDDTDNPWKGYTNYPNAGDYWTPGGEPVDGDEWDKLSEDSFVESFPANQSVGQSNKYVAWGRPGTQKFFATNYSGPKDYGPDGFGNWGGQPMGEYPMDNSNAIGFACGCGDPDALNTSYYHDKVGSEVSYFFDKTAFGACNYPSPSLILQWREGFGDSWSSSDGTIPYDRSSIDLQYRTAAVTSCSESESSWSTAGGTDGAWDADYSVNAPSQGSYKDYTISCTGKDGSSVQSTVRINRDAPPVAPTASLEHREVGESTWRSNSSYTYEHDAEIELQWSSSNADDCDAEAGSGFNTYNATIGTDSTINEPTAGDSETYTIECIGAGGTDQDTVTLSRADPPPRPVASVEHRAIGESNWWAANRTYDYDAEIEIQWSSTDADECIVRSGSGFQTYNAISGIDDTINEPVPGGSSISYGIECTGAGGNDTDAVTVSRAAPPPSPTASLEHREVGESTWRSNSSYTYEHDAEIELQWSSSNADGCSAVGGAGFYISGSQTSGTDSSIDEPAPGDTEPYTVGCTGPSGYDEASVDITSTNLPAAPSISFDSSVNGGAYTTGNRTIDDGDQVTLRWDVSNADSCSFSGSGFWAPSTDFSSTDGITEPLPGDPPETYSISCTNAGGTNTASIEITTTAPSAPTCDNLSGPSSAELGDYITISAETSGELDGYSGTWLTDTGDFTANLSVSSDSVFDLTYQPSSAGTETIDLLLDNGATSVTCPAGAIHTVSITDTASTSPESDIAWSADNTTYNSAAGSIAANVDTLYMRLSARYADNCTLEPGESDEQTYAMSNTGSWYSRTVWPIDAPAEGASRTYNIACTNTIGTATDSVTVTRNSTAAPDVTNVRIGWSETSHTYSRDIPTVDSYGLSFSDGTVGNATTDMFLGLYSENAQDCELTSTDPTFSTFTYSTVNPSTAEPDVLGSPGFATPASGATETYTLTCTSIDTGVVASDSLTISRASSTFTPGASDPFWNVDYSYRLNGSGTWQPLAVYDTVAAAPTDTVNFRAEVSPTSGVSYYDSSGNLQSEATLACFDNGPGNVFSAASWSAQYDWNGSLDPSELPAVGANETYRLYCYFKNADTNYYDANGNRIDFVACDQNFGSINQQTGPNYFESCIPETNVTVAVSGGGQCSDGIDNDGDQTTDGIDATDNDCHTDGDANDGDATHDPTLDEDGGGGSECSNAISDDGDALIDSDDPNCHTDGDAGDGDDTYDPTNDDEGSGGGQCSDGIDNDGDNKNDEFDPDCHTDGNPFDTDPANPKNDPSYDSTADEDTVNTCNDTDDNGGDGNADENDPECHDDGIIDTADPQTEPSYDPTLPELDSGSCGDGNDNDSVNGADGNDPDCTGGGSGPYDPTADEDPAPVPTINYIRACEQGGGSCQTGTATFVDGTEVEIQWDTTDATDCSAIAGGDFDTGGIPSGTDDTITEPGANNTDTFQITCDNSGGPSVSGSVTVETTAASPGGGDPTLEFDGGSDTRVIDQGEDTDIGYTTGGFAPGDCVLEQKPRQAGASSFAPLPGVTLASTGSVTVAPLSDTTYQIRCDDGNTTGSAEVEVRVRSSFDEV